MASDKNHIYIHYSVTHRLYTRLYGSTFCTLPKTHTRSHPPTLSAVRCVCVCVRTSLCTAIRIYFHTYIFTWMYAAYDIVAAAELTDRATLLPHSRWLRFAPGPLAMNKTQRLRCVCQQHDQRSFRKTSFSLAQR